MDQEGDGVGVGCVMEIATIPAAERNASSLSSAVGVVARFETALTAPASVTTESSSSPLFSVVDAGTVGAVSGVGGVRRWAIVFVKKLMMDWVQPEGLGLLRVRY